MALLLLFISETCFVGDPLLSVTYGSRKATMAACATKKQQISNKHHPSPDPPLDGTNCLLQHAPLLRPRRFPSRVSGRTKEILSHHPFECSRGEALASQERCAYPPLLPRVDAPSYTGVAPGRAFPTDQERRRQTYSRAAYKGMAGGKEGYRGRLVELLFVVERVCVGQGCW